MEATLFGDDNAMFDALLLKCYVQPRELSDKPILTGRWGIGKTAAFVHANAELAAVLKSVGCEDRKLWFISESALNAGSLATLQSRFGVNREGFKRSLELLWKAEIIRTMCMLLSKLRSHYGCPDDAHWHLVSKAAKATSFVRSVWERIPDLAGLLLGSDRSQPIATLADVLEKKHCQGMFDAIQRCLRDIRGARVQPVVLVEPLDTPSSGLEEGAIAQILITALLNVYYDTFAPSENQLVQLRVSIPWHRFRPNDVDFPQRFAEYVGQIRWDPQSLKEFISRRIEWEFKRISRSFSGRVVDAWETLFEDRVWDDLCDSKVGEDSFRYFLRHTHYRPRELLHLTRRCVEKQASVAHTSVDDVLQGRGGRKIPGSIMKETIREVTKETMMQSFIPELRRKYGDDEVALLLGLLDGISMPFTVDTIKKKYGRVKGTDAMPARLNSIVEKWWTSGIIGVEIVPASESRIPILSHTFPREAFCRYVTNGRSIYRYYLFEYNWEGDPTQLLLRYEKSEEATAGFVLHPRTFQQLLPRPGTDCPIGV
jgi:hypothetical protein